MKKHLSLPYDFLGIASATLCMGHCLLLPLLTILPLGLFDEIWIDTLFACIGTVVVYKILISNASKTVKILLSISLSIIIISVLLDYFFGIHFGLILVGGVGMIVAHLINFKSHYRINKN